MADTVEFNFTLSKVQNMRDGGYRVTLDVPSQFAAQVASLLVHADHPGTVGQAHLELRETEQEGTL